MKHCRQLFLVIALLVFGYQNETYSGTPEDSYTPVYGDIIFQSLPHAPLVDAIEGSTKSPFSHVGIVVEKEGMWFVLEAKGQVKETPLRSWISRGREHRFAVYRLENITQGQVDHFVEAAYRYLGRPYDIRYRMDEEKIYCAELVYKAYMDSADERLGELVMLGELDWAPYQSLIKKIEGGPVPLERKMITPKHLSRANQLTLVYNDGFGPYDTQAATAR